MTDVKDFDFSQEPGKKLKIKRTALRRDAMVSIISAFFNSGEHFEQTYRSVLNQTFPWFEWIIIDDGSTNLNDVNLLKQLAASDERIVIIRQENKGLSAARNSAIEASTTDIIVPLDTDDLIEPQFLEYLYWGLYYNPQASWCYSDSVGFGTEEYLWVKKFSSEKMKEENQLVCTAAIRKKALLEVGGYIPEKWHYNEDWRLWLSLMAKGHFPVHVRGALFWYRRQHKSMLTDITEDKEKKIFNENIIQKAAQKVIKEIKAIEFPQSEQPITFSHPVFQDFLKDFDTRGEEKRKVMMLIPWTNKGGADKFNLDVLRLLDKEKYEISILTTQKGENVWEQKFTKYTDELFHLPNFLKMTEFAQFIHYFISSRRIEIIFLSNSYYGYYLLPWLRACFPNLIFVDYVHMEEWYYRAGGFGRLSGVNGMFLEQTWVCNGKTEQVLIQHFKRLPQSVKTLYIGVDTAYFNPEMVDIGIAKRALNIAENRPIILFPCRMHPQKRPFLMLSIAERVHQICPEIAFVAVGDGPDLVEMQTFVQNKGLQRTVYFAGAQSDMRPFYRDATLTLICSINEGLSLTAYESVSMGVPVITSDVGGQKELINSSVGAVLPLLQDEVDEFNEKVFSENEINQYVKIILSFLKDKGKLDAMRICCRERAVENFSIALMARKLDAEFDRLYADCELREKRKQLSKQILLLKDLSEEYLGLYIEYENSAQISDSVWQSKEYFERLYLEQQIRTKSAEKQLATIQNLRSWRWIERYHKLVNNSFLGRIRSLLSRLKKRWKR